MRSGTEPTPSAAPGVAGARVRSEAFGTLADGRPVQRHELAAAGLRLQLIDLGGIVTGLWVPGRDGVAANVTLGFDTLAAYERPHPHFGTIVGRVANRIAGATLRLDGRHHALSANDGPHCLHGGATGFGRRLWRAEPPAVAPDGSARIRLHLHSADGDQGFPGAMDVRVTYTLGPTPQWRIDHEAVCDAPTVVNLSQHAYFNLAGGGSALGHRLWLRASRYLPVDAGLIPLADPAPVDGTPFDFRRPQTIESRIREPGEQLLRAHGYDHHFVLDRDQPGLLHAATLADPASGRTMQVWTTEPGIQLYSGNFLDGSLAGADGRPMRQGDGLCLETQHPPDSTHPSRQGPDWPSVRLSPGQRFVSSTVYRFSWDDVPG